jgi:hypothetical protein
MDGQQLPFSKIVEFPGVAVDTVSPTASDQIGPSLGLLLAYRSA